MQSENSKFMLYIQLDLNVYFKANIRGHFDNQHHTFYFEGYQSAPYM